MLIYFIRHGHPDYKNDCLTELGKAQAERASERLSTFGIEQIYASTKGRAMETAKYTADVIGLPIVPCDFMREISWASINGDEILENGHPWNAANALASRGVSVAEREWYNMEPYCKSEIVEKVSFVKKGFDELLLKLGYEREGEYYRVVGDDTDKTIAMFSHAGSSSAVISHLLNIPFSQVCAFLHMDFTSIMTIKLSNEKGALICPKLWGANDAHHLLGIDKKTVYDN